MMKMFQNSASKAFTWLSCFVLMASAGATQVSAADSKLEVHLVWGTNDEGTSKHKSLEPLLAKKLGMFKWKKYYTVNRKEIALDQDPQKISLSKKCDIKVKQLDEHRYEINVYGEGKHVRKITEKITKEDSLVIAGDDKNDCAWFILIREF